MALMHYLDHALTLVGNWGYLILFLIILLESFPVTFFLPGDSLLFTAGFLASIGKFNAPLLVVVAFAGGTFGYFLSYWTGEKLREIILRKGHSLWFKKKHIEYTQQFFDKYGTKTIIIGRFIPVVRSLAPFLAGAADMKYHKFLLYTFIGGIGWTGGLTLLGYYLGRLVPNINLYIVPIVVAISIISIIPSVYEYLSMRRKEKAAGKL